MLLNFANKGTALSYQPYDPDDHDGQTPIIVPLHDIRHALDHRGDSLLAVLVTGETAFGEIAPYLESVSMIQITFPAFTDGRGFTLATRLRRAGFSGDLRAAGPLIPDQGWHLKRTGFSSLHLADPSRANAFLASTHSFDLPYQRSAGSSATVIEQRFQEGGDKKAAP